MRGLFRFHIMTPGVKRKRPAGGAVTVGAQMSATRSV